MKYATTHVGAAEILERLVDDGWPEDAGGWPERCKFQLHIVSHPGESAQKGRRLSPTQFISMLLRSQKRA
jgi:hypothetical protein